MTFNRADFSYTATASGYMIQYKGQNIGGAGTLQPYKGRKRVQQATAHGASAMRCITELVAGRGQQRFLYAIERIDNPAPLPTKPARYISFASGIVCAAHNVGEWSDPLIQLQFRVLSAQSDAKLLDEDYNVVAEMTYMEASALLGLPAESSAPAETQASAGITTAWKAIPTSDTLYRYVQASHRVWSRMADGEHIFTVRPINETPGSGDGGYASIAAALKVKGLLR